VPFRRVRSGLVLLFGLLLVDVGAGVGFAQSRAGCQEPERPSAGVAVGRSSPYVELAREVLPVEQPTSVFVRSGWQITGRGDVTIGGPFRLRIEGSTARWDVVRETYSPELNYQLVDSRSIGHISVRQIGAAIGLRGGRRPVCGHVLVGGGLYSLTFRDDTLRRPGISFAAGIEVPTGARGVVQVDLQLHIIDTKNQRPVSGSAALAAGLVAGWAYRF